jgi:BASS family bile acid:Na+ symporter
MTVKGSWLSRISQFVQRWFLTLLVASYIVAAWAPALGLWIRDVSLGELSLAGTKTNISLSMAMLAVLLGNAGLGVEPGKLQSLFRGPQLLGAGLLANTLVPIGFIYAASWGMQAWHNPDEVQNILVGLALVASMPIAGSSTAWAQNADGELSLSLGLILGSTLLSPLLTPLALHAIGFITTGDYSEDLHELAAGGTGGFLAVCVLAPSLLGIAARRVIGNGRYAAARPLLKLVNSAILLILNYANASVSLPRTLANPDPDFLGMTLAIVTSLCVLAFAAGALVPRLWPSTTPAQRKSLMFGLGMNNNGTGLVLASMALADHPGVMLPIIMYNLVQHLVAGVADRLVREARTAPAR